MSDLPFHAIPAAPERLSSGALLARLLDGIGFRYRWATEGIDAADLAFRPAPDCMSLGELLGHIHGLLRWIAGTAGLGAGQEWMAKVEGLAARDATLAVAAALRAHFAGLGDAAIEAISVKSSRGDSYPFWNLVNGPLSDALTHIGQVASWRRIMGKPVPKADVFRGLPPA